MHDGGPPPTQAEAVMLVNEEFDLTSLQGTRKALHTAILDAGVSIGRAHDYTFAINEGLINTISHGGGRGEVSLAQAGDRLIAVIQDYTHTPPIEFPKSAPHPSAQRGRGLWLIAQSCDIARFETNSSGLRLVMELALEPPDPTQ
jgi:anti-sigma regulatory factor (Ser/Thr protein kinase)